MRPASAALAAFILVFGLAAARADPQQDPSALRGWAMSLYGGVGTDGGIEDIPGLEADFNNAYMATLAVSREIARWKDLAAVEIEGQIARHFVKQRHWETNLLLVARWHAFPWNRFVRTSIAVGEGVSYASSIPVIEQERSPGKNSRLLNYLMFELELAPPDKPNWSVFARIHHRSGVFGLYDDVSLGSNIVAAGIRFRF